VICRNKNRIRLFASNGRQLRFEVRVASLESLNGSDGPAKFFKLFLKKLCQSQAVIGLKVLKNRHPFHFQMFEGKLGHHGTLKRIDKTNPKNKVTDFGHFWIR